jgi:O-antigen/teichoic acid export membrane protein
MLKSLLNVGLFAGLQFLISVALNYFLSKILSPEDFGIYFYILSTTQLISTILIFGLTASVVRFFENIYDKYLVEKILRNILAIISLIYISFLLFSYFFSIGDYIFKGHNQIYWIIVLVQVPFIIENLINTSFYWAKNDFFKRGLFTNLFNLAQLLFVILYYYEIVGVNVFYSMILARVINTIILAYYIKKDFELNIHKPSLDLKTLKSIRFKEFVKFGFWSALSTISILILDFVDRFVINQYLGSKSLGNYQSSIAIFSYVFMPYQLLSNVFLSQFLRLWESDKQKVIEKIQNFTLLSIILYQIIIYIIINNNELIITKFFSESYLVFSYKELYVFSFVFFIKIIYSLVGSLSFISNNPKFLTKALLVCTLCSIILDYILVHNLKLMGILLSSIISFSILIFILYYQYHKDGIKFNWYYHAGIFIVTLYSVFMVFNN